MKHTVFSLLFLLLAIGTKAADGYKIRIKFSDYKDSMIYLAHYFGKPLPTIYKADSAKVDKNGIAVLSSKDTTLGGIYMILFEDKTRYFEILLNNGDNFSINVSSRDITGTLQFAGSAENERFTKYMNFLGDFGKKNQALESELAKAKTKTDTVAVYEKGKKLGKELTNYRTDYTKQYPNTLLTKIFNALKVPEVPAGTHYMPDGTVDSAFGYNYYKSHYWDGFDFTDDRLIHTPLYDTRLDEYFNKLVLPLPDSVEKEADILLAKTRGRKELFKYTLHWVTQWAQNSKVMGMDEVFVYMVENYHMKGDAYWMDNETLKKYVDRAQKVAPNVIGNIAPELSLVGLDGKDIKLSSVNSKYTLLIFWSPDCGHCQTEIPKIDSVYKASLKDKGVKIFAVKVGDEDKLWKDFLEKHKLKDWIHVHNPNHTSNYKADYDVYGTPSVYLLDEKKIIRGKKLDHENVITLLDILEKKKKEGKL
ncbi:hypothetical protein CAP35_10235 [Chitinophagaceae bacterium IBVUCB1]|nr:hypothetical protein CAP35_10235 [Chitinophagaceae bacterium IBVUCB1]